MEGEVEQKESSHTGNPWSGLLIAMFLRVINRGESLALMKQPGQLQLVTVVFLQLYHDDTGQQGTFSQSIPKIPAMCRREDSNRLGLQSQGCEVYVSRSF